MKANFKKKVPVTTTAEAIEKAMSNEINKLYDKIGYDISAQMLAVILTNLEINYGWRRDRLRAFMNNLHSAAELACGTDIFGKQVDTENLIDHIKNKYGIDCREEVRKM